MEKEYEVVNYIPRGDYHEEQEKRLFELFRQGFRVIATANNQYGSTFFLEREVTK